MTNGIGCNGWTTTKQHRFKGRMAGSADSAEARGLSHDHEACSSLANSDEEEQKAVAASPGSALAEPDGVVPDL
jgi:hypothetical protein